LEIIMKKLLVTMSSLALLVGCAQTESEMGASGTGSSAASGVAGVTTRGEASGQLTAADANFVKTAAQSGMAEVRMGQLFAEGAQSKALRDFGQRLVTDHTKANQELIQIAASKGFSAPSQPAAKHEKMMEGLSKLKGAEFDRSARQHAVMHHQEDVQMFQKASQSLKDPELKAFAQKTLPTLQEHLKMAQALDVGATTGTEPGSSNSTTSETQPQQP
jgi:putative membrane protein